MAEVYAGFLAHADHHIGRLLDYLEESGQRENTMVIVVSDNGASGEGGPNGSVNEMLFANGIPDDMQTNLAMIDELGGTKTYNHYPNGWAMAFNTPFKMWKRYEFNGGTADPCIISWPSATADATGRGELRHQYHHAIDIVPTILDTLGVQSPSTIKGHVQSPFDGVSMRYSVEMASAPSARKTQFYSMLGSRGIWHDGWKAVTTHPTLSGWGHFNDDTWELYHTDTDRAELHDLAAEHPDKVRELVNLWFAEAGENAAFPLDDRSALEIIITPRPQLAAPQNRYAYFPDTAEVPEQQAVNVRNRSYSIGALVDIPAPGAQGVLFAHGSRFGGHALYVKDNRLHYVYNFVGLFEQKIDGTEDLPVGENLILSASFDKDGEDPPGVATGVLSLYHGDKKVGEGRIKTQPGLFSLAGEGLCVGRDSGEAVTSRLSERTSRTHSPAARSSGSPSTSAVIRTSTSSARPWPCWPASRSRRRRNDPDGALTERGAAAARYQGGVSDSSAVAEARRSVPAPPVKARRHGATPSISVSSEKLRNVLITTISPSDEDIIDGRRDRHGANQVGGDQDFQPEQQGPAECLAQDQVSLRRPPGAPRGHRREYERPDHADYQDRGSQCFKTLGNVIHQRSERLGRRLGGSRGEDHVPLPRMQPPQLVTLARKARAVAVRAPAGLRPAARGATSRRRPDVPGLPRLAARRPPQEHARRPWRIGPPAATQARRPPSRGFHHLGLPLAACTASG